MLIYFLLNCDAGTSSKDKDIDVETLLCMMPECVSLQEQIYWNWNLKVDSI